MEPERTAGAGLLADAEDPGALFVQSTFGGKLVDGAARDEARVELDQWRGPEAALVILDAPVVPPRPFADTLRPFAAALRAPSYREAIRAFLSPFVGFADDPGRAQRLLADMAATPQHVIASTMDDYLAYDSAAAAACKVPLLYVSSGPWFADVARLRELCPQLVTGQTVGSGHYHQLEVPEQVNAMIDRFVAVTLVRRA
jgi:pimeloyl-ACP methyl ester carboxylesterase